MLKATKISDKGILYDLNHKVNLLQRQRCVKKSIERIDFMMICDKFLIFTDKYSILRPADAR